MGRSKPFSGKQKKDQLKEKKERKRIENAILDDNVDISLQDKRKLAKQLLNNNKLVHNNDSIVGSKIIFSNNQIKHVHTQQKNDEEDEEEEEDESSSDDEIEKSIKHINEINQQMKSFDLGNKVNNSGRKINKLVTIFEKESRDEIEKRKELSKKPLNTTLREQPWLIMKEYDRINYNEGNGSNSLNYIDIPKRPRWSYNMSGDKLKEEERIMFSQWLENIVIKYDKSRLNYFEHNLEVWRQLWRVCEKSDIILLVTDARYPLFHFPPSLYHYIQDDLKKPMILILNKIDLVDKRIIDAWIQYFTKNYPNLKVICFSSFSSLTSTGGQTNDKDNSGGIELDANVKRKLKRGRKRYDLSLGKQNLIDAILSLPIPKVNLISKDDYNTNNEKKDGDIDDGDSDDDSDDDSEDASEGEKEEEDDGRNVDDKVIIGMVGHPNVGKSSLINGMMGKKVVSTSRTPGHTKHFQTIVFTKNIQLLDCPGLVFPALDRPKQLQILCGLFPIAQVREPFSAIQYLAERVPVEEIYKLSKPEDEKDKPWSSYLICEAFAYKRGYLYAKSGRPDSHRAALELLKDCIDGNIVISWPPPGFTKEQYIESGLLNSTNNISQDDNNSNSSNNIDNQGKIKSNTSTNVSKKLNKKMKKKNTLKKLAFSEDENSSEEEADSEDEDEEIPIPQKSKNKPTSMFLDIDSDDEEEQDENSSEDSDSDSEEEADSEDEDEEIPITPKSNNNNNNNSKNTKTTSTTTKNNNNKNNNNKKSNKQGSTKESEYQERLKEKQNKGGNKRQVL